jgi:hypothetical protein
MKKKIIVVLSAIAFPFMIGYLLALGLLLGFLTSKFLAGKSAGEKGKLGSIIIPLMGLRIHLHHWLYSLWLMGISFVTGVHFLSPIITYGFLGGSAFQGIYSYGDWHVILLRRSKTTSRGHQPAAGSKKPARRQRATKTS